MDAFAVHCKLPKRNAISIAVAKYTNQMLKTLNQPLEYVQISGIGTRVLHVFLFGLSHC